MKVQETETLGDYCLCKRLEDGPLGALYLVEHRFIKKHYLLKLLPKELTADTDFVERFQSHLGRYATLEHPRLVKVHTLSCEGDQFFLVTDCILDAIGEMTHLAQYMSARQDRLREEELISVAKQVAGVIDYLHDQGTAHLSIQPNHIWIGPGKPGLDLFLSDGNLYPILHPAAIVHRIFWTVAQALDCLPSTQQDGFPLYAPHPFPLEKYEKMARPFLESFAFLAPEQKRSSSFHARADQYAFGVLMYYLITGGFPEGKFPSIQIHAPDYRCDWDRLLTDCLAPDPYSRPSRLSPLLDSICPALFPNEIRDTQREEPPSLPILPISDPIEARPSSIPGPRILSSCDLILRRPTSSLNPTTPISLERAVKKDLSEATAPPITPSPATQSVPSLLDREPVVHTYSPTPLSAELSQPLMTDMAWIPGGTYSRGSHAGNRDETPVHTVDLSSFAMDIHPVTNEQFIRFLEALGCEKDAQYNDVIRYKESRISRSGGKLHIEPGYAHHPVVGVTWYGATAYADWIGKRLPTEAEWEIASKGGDPHAVYPYGDDIDKAHANFFSADTTPVMHYPANGYGLFDMAGNVYEWCQDWYGYHDYEATVHEPWNPKGPVQGTYRVLRGGCWKSLKEDLRCAQRHRNNPGSFNSTYGFRCAADVDEELSSK